ncbi:MAG: S-layer homology domain-containing protein [Chloroflexota bacterium]
MKQFQPRGVCNAIPIPQLIQDRTWLWLSLALTLVCLFAFYSTSYASPDASPDVESNSATAAYRYEVNTTSWQCGTQQPAAGIIRARFEPDNATNKIRVYVAKCNGGTFSGSATIRIINDDSGAFQNWRYRTSTGSYRCGSDGIIEMELEPYSGDKKLRARARKCAGGGFSMGGEMYVAADGNIIAGPDSYSAGATSESITFTPLLLNAAGRHTYRAYFQSDNNAQGDYIISGSVDAWEEYHSYVSGSWSVSSGQREVSFLFDPAALGITGDWRKYQVHVFPSGQTYPIRSGIISARTVAIPQGDGYETDNHFTQSNTINTNGSSQTHTIHVPGDEDWMKFSAVAGHTYVIETFNLQGGANTVLGLFWDNHNDGHPDLIDADTSSGTSRISWTADQTATRWIKVRDNNTNLGGTSVKYSVRVTASAPQADAYEVDNVFTQSKSIPTNGSSQTHTFHLPGDEDWMRFDAVAGYTYVIETFNLQGGANTVLGLFWDNHNDNHPDLIAADTGNGASRISWTADQTATRWIKARDHNGNLSGTNVKYSVRINSSAPAGDNYETDNVFTQAKSIPTNGSSQTHTFHLPGDEDWMKFDAVTGYTYVLETFNLQGGANTVLGLFWDDHNDGHPDLIASDTGNGSSRVSWTADQTAVRWLKVRDHNANLSGTNVKYSVRVTASAPQGDSYETDNVFTQAKSITPNGSSQTHTFHLPGDEDWVKFDAVAGYNYVIETLNLQGGANTVLGLFWDDHNDGHPDLIVKDETNGTSRISWIADQSAVRWVKVRDHNGNLGGTNVKYSLKIMATPSQGDQYEPDDLFTQATPIGTNGSSQTHTIHVAQDNDWMSFDAIAGYEYVIETFNLQGGADTVLGLFWDDHNDGHPDLIDSDISGGTSRIVWTADQTTKRWIKVRDNNQGLGGTDVKYSVKITASGPRGDQYETDNVFTQATNISTNGSSQTHTIHVAGDEDWVKFNAITGYKYVIETFNLQGGANTVLGLFWDDHNDNHPDLIRKDDSAGASKIEWTADQTAVRWVKVRDNNQNYGGENVQYSIKITASNTQLPLRDRPVYGYQAPCAPGSTASVTSFHGINKNGKSPVDRNRRAYDWQCFSGATETHQVHAPIGGKVFDIRSAGSAGGMMMIDDERNDVCVILLHLIPGTYQVSKGNTVSQGQHVSAYSRGWGHVHMASLNGTCQANNAYVHSNERVIVFNELGQTMPPAISISGTAYDSDGPMKWVTTGDCVNASHSYCLVPNDDPYGGSVVARASRTASKYFDDVSGSVFIFFIDALRDAGVTYGCSSANPRLFCPDALLLREQAAAFMVRSLGLTSKQYTSYSYSDIDGSGTFDNDIEFLTELGIVSGERDGTFLPKNPVTRGQFAKMIINSLEQMSNSYTCVPENEQAFPDVPSSDTFYKYIQCLHQRGITSGYSDGTFQSGKQITRAESSKLIYLAFLAELQEFEQESENANNNNKSGASSLVGVTDEDVVATKRFTLPHNDVDWFKFGIPTEDAGEGFVYEYILQVEHGKNVVLDINIEDESGNEISYQDIDLDDDDILWDEVHFLRMEGVSAGETYYARIDNTMEQAVKNVEVFVNLRRIKVERNEPTCYSLNIASTPSNGGAVEMSPQPNCDGNKYTPGQVVTLSAASQQGYQFARWQGTANGLSSALTVNMNQDHNLTAVFEEDVILCYTLTYASNPVEGGDLEVSPAPNCEESGYIEGTAVTLNAVSQATHRFARWEGVPHGEFSAIELTMNQDHSVTAVFDEDSAPCYTLTLTSNPTNGGTIQASPQPDCENGQYKEGTNVIVNAVSESTHAFVRWEGATSSTSAAIEITMNEDQSLVAVFEEDSSPCYTLTMTSNPANGGTIQASPQPNCENGQYKEGTNVIVNAVSESTHVFVRWEGSVSGTVSSVEISMTEDYNLVAIFEESTSPIDPGDINGDSQVNIFDLQILIRMIVHPTQRDGDLYEAGWWDRGDLQQDNAWNIFDLQKLIGLITS